MIKHILIFLQQTIYFSSQPYLYFDQQHPKRLKFCLFNILLNNRCLINNNNKKLVFKIYSTFILLPYIYVFFSYPLTTWPPDHLTTWPPDHLTTWPPDHLTTWPPDHLTTWPPGHLTTCFRTCFRTYFLTCNIVRLTTLPLPFCNLFSNIFHDSHP